MGNFEGKKYRCGFSYDEYKEVHDRRTPELRECVKVLFAFLRLEYINPTEYKFYSAEDVCNLLNENRPNDIQEYDIKRVQSLILTIAISYGPIFVTRINPKGVESYKLYSYFDTFKD